MVWSLAQTSLGCAVMIVRLCGIGAFGSVRDGAEQLRLRASAAAPRPSTCRILKAQPRHTLPMALAGKMEKR